MVREDMAGATFCTSDCALAAGSTTTMTCGKATDYCIKGKAHTAPAISAVQPATTDINTGVAMAGIPPGFGTVIVFGLSSSESTALLMAQGEIVALTANASAYHPGSFIDVPEWPGLPSDFCPIGYATIKVATDYTAGAKYVFGTSDTTATGSQNSAATAHENLFTSVLVLPARPQVS